LEVISALFGLMILSRRRIDAVLSLYGSLGTFPED